MRSRLCFVTISLSFAPDRGAWALSAFGLFDYFLAWSGIFEIFDVVFSCGIWCYGTAKGKMNFFPLSYFLLSNFGGNEKVCNTRNPAYL